MANAPVLASVGVFIGLLLIFNALAGWIFGFTIKPFPSPFGDGAAAAGRLCARRTRLGSTAVTLIVLLSVWAFFRFTPLGLAMRAAAYNPVSARLVGVRVSRMLALGWGLAAAIGAVAGIMVAPVVFLDPNMMAGILLYAFAGALLGGIDNPLGAVIGGFLVGVHRKPRRRLRRRHRAEADRGADHHRRRAGDASPPGCSAAPIVSRV